MNKKVIVQLSAALMLAGLVACSSSSETTKIEPVALEQDPNLCYFDSTETVSYTHLTLPTKRIV